MDLQAKLVELADLQRQRDVIEAKMMALFAREPKPESEKKRGRPKKEPPAVTPLPAPTPLKVAS